jgi:hypothetical protein
MVYSAAELQFWSDLKEETITALINYPKAVSASYER